MCVRRRDPRDGNVRNASLTGLSSQARRDPRRVLVYEPVPSRDACNIDVTRVERRAMYALNYVLRPRTKIRAVMR